MTLKREFTLIQNARLHACNARRRRKVDFPAFCSVASKHLRQSIPLNRLRTSRCFESLLSSSALRRRRTTWSTGACPRPTTPNAPAPRRQAATRRRRGGGAARAQALLRIGAHVCGGRRRRLPEERHHPEPGRLSILRPLHRHLVPPVQELSISSCRPGVVAMASALALSKASILILLQTPCASDDS